MHWGCEKQIVPIEADPRIGSRHGFSVHRPPPTIANFVARDRIAFRQPGVARKIRESLRPLPSRCCSRSRIERVVDRARIDVVETLIKQEPAIKRHAWLDSADFL